MKSIPLAAGEKDIRIPAMVGTVMADHGKVPSAKGLFQFVTPYQYA